MSMKIEQIMEMRATDPLVYTWSRLAEIWNRNTGEHRTASAMRNMGRRARIKAQKSSKRLLSCEQSTERSRRIETHEANGTTQIECSIPNSELDRSPNGILKAIGYSPDEWKITK